MTTTLAPFTPAHELDTRKQLPIFVYGTLKAAYGNHQLIRPFLLASGPGTLDGAAMFTPQPDGGPFPFLVPTNDPVDVVHGELCFLDDGRYEEAIERMDRLEGYREGDDTSLYVRCQVQVTMADGHSRVDAWVYIAGELSATRARRMHRVANGNWKPASRS